MDSSDEFKATYDAREALYKKHFGPPNDQVIKLQNLFGVWPGGCLLQAPWTTQKLWVTSSFGLSNPDMPTPNKSEEKSVQTKDGKTTTESVLTKREPRPAPEGASGYGYEFIVLTKEREQWPYMFLNWAVPGEILQDIDFLRRLENRAGLTIQDINLGDGEKSDFLITRPVSPVPESIGLPAGTCRFLVAVAITRAEMQLGMEAGPQALIDVLSELPQWQVSDIGRESQVK